MKGILSKLRNPRDGKSYFRLSFQFSIQFGLTETKARVSWMEGVGFSSDTSNID